MSWREVSQGIWQRPRGDNETFIHLVGQLGLPLRRENWAITSQVPFGIKGASETTGSDQLEGILREAWRQLRFLHPSIAAWIEGDQIIYEVPGPTALLAWESETFTVASPETSSADVIAGRKPNRLSLLTYVPHESQVLFSTSHWRTDGIGILMILDTYFDLVAECAAGNGMAMVWGAEVCRLGPSIEEICDFSPDQSPENMATAARLTDTFKLGANCVGIRYQGDSTTAPSGTRVQLLQLTEPETTALHKACRSQNISVTSAVHASVARANYHFAATDAHRSKPYTSTIRFALRPYVPSHYAEKEYGAVLLTSGYMLQVPPTADWCSVAQAVNDQYRAGYGQFMPLHQQYARQICDTIRNMPAPDPAVEPPSDLDISSLGVIDKYIKPVHKSGLGDREVEVELQNVTVGVELVNRQTVCYVWTFRGRLNLQIVYNEAYHQDYQIKELLEYIRDVTMERLHLSGSRDRSSAGDRA